MFSFTFLRNSISKPIWSRNITISSILRNENIKDNITLEYREVTKDRSQIIPVETSIKYLKSPAYQQTYGSDPVWKLYRRNHKGRIPPKKTRKTCIRAGVISTGNPCPICRDEYLVLSEHNTELLKQFVCPHTGEILSFSKTGLCQVKHTQLLVALKRAYNFGLLTFDVPFRAYDYTDYYKVADN
ncbi:28S ribosomal protein S18b, mitochondrial [Coccinella septempunctata]|uniref:28S ribosomal protein S18b, mitochondrial n=1 Tax=Coccinella septempunctata TaxID=41139 RepID=UPI001D07E254|nr:28S ribosomal protein S18b, mitochondrial [Coccinella septempunctata]